MNKKLDKVEELIGEIKRSMMDLKEENEDFQSIEDRIKENIEAAKLSKNLALTLISLDLAQKKLAKKLTKDDSVLRKTK